MNLLTPSIYISLIILLFIFTKVLSRSLQTILCFFILSGLYLYHSNIQINDLNSSNSLLLLFFGGALLTGFEEAKRNTQIIFFYLIPLLIVHIMSDNIFTYAITTLALLVFDFLTMQRRKSKSASIVIPLALQMFFVSFFYMGTENSSFNVVHVASSSLFYMAYFFFILGWLFWFCVKTDEIKDYNEFDLVKLLMLTTFAMTTIKLGRMFWFEIDVQYTSILFDAVVLTFSLIAILMLLKTFYSNDQKQKFLVLFLFQLMTLFITQIIDTTFLSDFVIMRNIIVLCLSFYVLKDGLNWLSNSIFERILKTFIFVSFIGLPLVMYSVSYEILITSLIKNEMYILASSAVALYVVYLAYAINLIELSKCFIEKPFFGHTFPSKEFLACGVIISTYCI